MKRILFTVLVLGLLTSQGFGQSSRSNDAARLQKLLEQTSPTQPVPVHVLEKESAVQINNHVIPLAETTLVQWDKEKGKYRVNFFLQNGTAVTRLDDPAFRRAHWTLELPSKQACQEFIALFDRLRTEVKKG